MTTETKDMAKRRVTRNARDVPTLTLSQRMHKASVEEWDYIPGSWAGEVAALEAALELSTAKTVREMADVEKLVSAIRGKRLGGMSPDEYDSWFNTGLEGAIEAIAQTVGIDYRLIAQAPEEKDGGSGER